MKLGDFTMEKLKPAFLKNSVPICFSANDNYVPMLAAEIASIIEHSNPKNNYDIVVLMTEISDANKFKLLTLIAKHANFSIRFVNVSAYIYGYNFYIESDASSTKYSSEIYFRILAPAIMADYEHVIFLDADLIVLDDIAKLLKLADNTKLLSAVRDYEGIANCYNNNYERTKYRISELGIANFDDYFVSGVIILNNKLFNEKFDSKQLLDMAVSKNWKQYDQDLLNYLCKDSVNLIDAEWDFVEDIFGIYHSLPKPLLKEFENSENTPKIIHFSGARKPWKNTRSKYNKYFWKYAEMCPFKDELKALLKED